MYQKSLPKFCTLCRLNYIIKIIFRTGLLIVRILPRAARDSVWHHQAIKYVSACLHRPQSFDKCATHKHTGNKFRIACILSMIYQWHSICPALASTPHYNSQAVSCGSGSFDLFLLLYQSCHGPHSKMSDRYKKLRVTSGIAYDFIYTWE